MSEPIPATAFANRVAVASCDKPTGLDIMLVNDDSYTAAGLAAVRDALLEAGNTVTVVAPLEQQSGNGTALDAEFLTPIAVTEFRPGDYNVDGTPVVTTLAGLGVIFADRAPELVVSGANAGANVGDIAINSGTVSAAVTAILRGVPAIAISGEGMPEDDAAAAGLVTALVSDLAARKADGLPILPEGTGLNVNVPSAWNGRDVAYTHVSGSSGVEIVVQPATGGDGDDVTIGATVGLPRGTADSEGINFANGNATISVMDGDWSAAAEDREALATRLDDLDYAAPSEAGRALEIMLVNDDGFDAPGITELAEALRAAGHTVRIVAPATQQSGQGTTLDTGNFGQTIEVTEFAPGDYAVATSPFQVTRAGLDVLLADTPPDLVISGINEGENVGTTAISSGTVSAAVSALYRDVPAIAVSAGLDLSEAAEGFPSTEAAYEVGAAFVTDLVADLIATEEEGELLPGGVGLSVNVPTGDIAGVSFTKLDEVTPLGIEFGPVPGGDGLTFTPGAPNGDPLSEGSEFLLGNITVTAIDGNYTAPEPVRGEVEGQIAEGAALAALLAEGAEPAPAPLDITVAARFQGEPADDPEGAAEIVEYAGGKLYVTNGNLGRIDIFPLDCPKAADSIDLTGIPGFAGVQSVAIAGGLIAAAVSTLNTEVALPPSIGGTAVLPSNGVIAFFDAETNAPRGTVEVGNLPDMVTFTKDGGTLLVANEGEFNGDSETTTNPAGSVSIISTADFSVRTVDFAALAGFEDAARAAGIRVAPGEPLSLDIEPEYIALSPDETRAFVTLQENNAVAVIDVASATLTDILPIGVVDHGLAGNEIDPLDNGVIDLKTFENLVGLRMPDGIVSFEQGGETYFATANEGDGRGFDEARVEDLIEEGRIDASVDTTDLERLTVSTVDGDTDGDGDIDVLNAFGGRSFTIFDAAGGVVYESGSDLAELIATVAPERFQDDEGLPDENRSDAKGVEPEAIEIGTIGEDTFLFVGMERDSGIAVFNVNDPTAPALVDYIDGFATDDISPEGLEFVAATEDEDAMLLASYELSGTTVAYQLASGAADPVLV